ncbi:MAG: hypothetical protein PHE27_03305 [Alphaproteobacteria bacterium]|nr:hypothetical protein [Alphaproteobacteria bacterium]
MRSSSKKKKKEAAPEAAVVPAKNRQYNLYELVQEKTVAAEAVCSLDARRAKEAVERLAQESWTKANHEIFASERNAVDKALILAEMASYVGIFSFAFTGIPLMLAPGIFACVFADRMTKALYDGGPADPMHDPNFDYKPSKTDPGSKESYLRASAYYERALEQVKDTDAFKPGGRPFRLAIRDAFPG